MNLSNLPQSAARSSREPPAHRLSLCWFPLLLGLLLVSQAVAQPFEDQDNDGLPDDWERQFGLDPTNNADALLDSNSDGLNNLTEFVLRGNPLIGDRTIRPQPGRSADGRFLTLSIVKRAVTSKTRLEVQRAHGPIEDRDWSANGLSLVSRELDAAARVERLVYQLDTPISELPSQFLRVRLRFDPNEPNVLFHTTLDNLASITDPLIGLPGTTTLQAVDFVPARERAGAHVIDLGKVAIFPAADGIAETSSWSAARSNSGSGPITMPAAPMTGSTCSLRWATFIIRRT